MPTPARLMRLLPLAVALLPGCSLLFDPAGLVGTSDAGVHLLDDGGGVSDGGAAIADCGGGLTLFPGFNTGTSDGGSDGGGLTTTSFDCNACGCLLDDFNATPGPPRWTTTSSGGPWSIVAGGGRFNLVTGSPTSAFAQIYSENRFYIDGDFTLLVDFEIQTWTPGAVAVLYALGPAPDGGVNVPTLAAYVNNTMTGEHSVALVNGAPFDYPGGAMTGTFQLSRQKGQLCASVQGVLSGCRPIPSVERVAVLLIAAESCTACGALAVVFKRPRVTSGRLVSTR